MFGRLTSDPRRRALLLGALGAVVALLIGYLAGLVTPRFTAPGDNSPEAVFARDMSVHPALAVEMGEWAYQTATNDEVLMTDAFGCLPCFDWSRQ